MGYEEMSIHFHTKNQSIEDIRYTFDWYLENSKFKINDDFILNHCFLPRTESICRGCGTDSIDFIESICNNTCSFMIVCGMDIQLAREKLADMLDKKGGFAMFIGDVSGSVLEEYEIISKKENILKIMIPLFKKDK